MDIMTFWVSEHVAHKVTPHTHDFYQLIYSKTTGGSITIGTTKYAARPHFVYLAKPGTKHSIENHAELYILELKFIAEGAASAELCTLPDAFDISDLPFAREMLELTIREGLIQQLHYHDAANAALRLFFVSCLRKFSKWTRRESDTYAHSSVLDTPGKEQARSDVQILNLKYYIANHLHEKITLDDLAGQVSFNRTFFIKRFQQLFEMPPIKYVNFMRIARSKQLLIQTSLPITVIAAKTGFGSLHYFSRSFHALEGMSPQQFRKIYGKG